jgi:S1-C subfamily serine protease
MARNILKILLIFVLGALGGVWTQIYLLPYLAGLSYFQDFQFVKNLKEREMIVNPRTEITVQENVALQGAVERVEKVVIGVKTRTKEGEILKGSGLIVTSDGLLVTLADLVPRGSNFFFYVDDQWPAYQILKRDLENNLALVKIKGGALPTTGFADLEKTKLGERVFLMGTVFKENSTGTDSFLLPPEYIVNKGIIKSFNKDLIQTNILEDLNISGSPLFDIGGNVVGLNTVDEEGRVSAIPATKIRQFIGM